MKPASILKRAVAFFIDKTILMIVLMMIGSILTELTPHHTMMDSARELWDKAIQLIPGHTPSLFARIASKLIFFSTHFYSAHLTTTLMLCVIISFIYFVGFEHSKWQATIGKRLLRLKVVDSANKRISIWAASKRLLLLAAPAVILHLLVFTAYPQCLKIHHHLLGGIEIPTICVTLFVGYAITYLIWFIPVFFTKDKVTLYDALSDTKVKD